MGGKPQHMKGLQRTYLHLGLALICSVQRPQHLKNPSSRQIYHIHNTIYQHSSNVLLHGPIPRNTMEVISLVTRDVQSLYRCHTLK